MTKEEIAKILQAAIKDHPPNHPVNPLIAMVFQHCRSGAMADTSVSKADTQ